MVESLLPKQVVVGSNPIARSKIPIQHSVDLNPRQRVSKGVCSLRGETRGGWPPQWEPGGRPQGRPGDGVWFKSHRPLQTNLSRSRASFIVLGGGVNPSVVVSYVLAPTGGFSNAIFPWLPADKHLRRSSLLLLVPAVRSSSLLPSDRIVLR